MTTLQMQFASYFLAPLTEDLMELTPDTDQRAGGADEIDIDIDFNGDNPHDGEDEFMGEEDMDAPADSTSAEGKEAHVANDDEMTEDGYAQVLADEGSSGRDEDIEDAGYTGPELDEDTIVESDTDHLTGELLANYREINGDQNHEQEYQEQEFNEEEHGEYPTTPDNETGLIQGTFPGGRTERLNTNYEVANLATGETSEEYNIEISKEATIDLDAAEQASNLPNLEGIMAPEAKFEQVREEILSFSPDREVEPQSNVERSQTQEEDSLSTLAQLHPIILDYQGDEMFLFPPVDQIEEHAATFLLADEQLAYSAVGNLLEACRAVLKGSLSEQDELVINIDDLDLHISESTFECASTKLSEVVALYIHLQKNDGLENPPPLYINLTARNSFSHRLNVLRNASIEGTGLSQLKSPQETEIGQYRKTEGELEPPNHSIVLSSDEAYVSEQQPREDAEGGMDQYDSRGHPPPSEILMLETDSGAQGTQSYPIKDVAHKENNHAEPLPGSDSSAHEAEVSSGSFSEAVESKESLDSAHGAELHRAEESIVNDGDFIDYDDTEQLEGGASSASSTLQGDTNDGHAVQDNAAPDKPVVAQRQEHQEHQEHQSSLDVKGDAVADEKTTHEYVVEKVTGGVGVPVEEEYLSATEIPFQNSDDKGQTISVQFDEEREASDSGQDVNISQGTSLQLKANIDEHHEASPQYQYNEDSDWQDTMHRHADQTKGDACAAADTNFNVEDEDCSSTHPSDPDLNRSRRGLSDDDLESINNLEAENSLEEINKSMANDGSDRVPRVLEKGTKARPSLVPDELAQMQDDDDEITYEDEEYDIDSSHELAQANHNVATSPGSLKRARSPHEDDGTLEDNLQGAKRVRSG